MMKRNWSYEVLVDKEEMDEMEFERKLEDSEKVSY